MTNYTVPGATFSNGAPITLDLAWPEFRVAIEYDGDHHRTDKNQWRRDNDKRELLRHHHWIVIIATAANMADEHPKPNSPTGSGGSWHCEVPYSISL